MKNEMLHSVFLSMQYGGLGSEVNSEKSVQVSDDEIEIHFWDGRRFLMKVTKLPEGCAYDCNTGKPILPTD